MSEQNVMPQPERWDFAPCWRRVERGQGVNEGCVALCPECFAHGITLPDEVRAETRAWWRRRMAEEAER